MEQEDVEQEEVEQEEVGLGEDVHVKLYDLNGGANTGGLLTTITITSAAELWWLPNKNKFKSGIPTPEKQL